MDSAYCYKFRTDNGYADIIFRNSSNVYYGGECELRYFSRVYMVKDRLKTSLVEAKDLFEGAFIEVTEDISL